MQPPPVAVSASESGCIVGIDPGKKGALVALSRSGELVGAWRTPVAGKEYDLAAMRELLCSSPVAMAGVERVWGMRGDGVASSFTFGEGLGLWRGMLAGLQVPVVMLLPRRWQAVTFQGRQVPKASSDRKAEIAALAKERWPTIPIQCKADQGMGDAAWIAEVARRDLCRV